MIIRSKSWTKMLQFRAVILRFSRIYRVWTETATFFDRFFIILVALLCYINLNYLEIKELFENEGIENFIRLPDDVSVKAKFALLFNRLNSILEMIKVQDFTWKINVYGETTVLITEEIYYILSCYEIRNV